MSRLHVVDRRDPHDVPPERVAERNMTSGVHPEPADLAKSTSYLRPAPTDGTVYGRSVPSPLRPRIPEWQNQSESPSVPVERRFGVADGAEYSFCPIWEGRVKR